MTEPEDLQRLRVADDVVVRELDGEAVILHLASGTYFGLDEMGTRVWRHLDRRDTVDEVVNALVEEYDVDANTARSDVQRLVTQLYDRGLLVPVSAVEPGA